MSRASLFNKLIRSESVNSDDTLIALIKSVLNVLVKTNPFCLSVKITLRVTLNGSGIVLLMVRLGPT